MENDKLATQGLDDQKAVIMEQFIAAMTALQFQDIQSSEQALIKSKIIYKNLEVAANHEDNDFLKIIVGFIEITSRFLKSNFYLADERFKKAMEELVAAKQICEEVSDDFKSFTPELIEEYDEDGMFSAVKFLYAFYEHIIVVMHGITQKSLEQKEGKYIDEIEINRMAAIALRKFDFQSHYMSNPELSNIATGSVAMLNRIADTFDKKVERLEEKRKVIEFLRPVDKKIFIVHGHNEGALRELKEMLENNFKIDPIILREEMDKGKTVIEKIEEYGRQCAFAFVIITPDDIVENKKKKSFQARPNVLFELGWFCGRYGRSKVRILRQQGTSLPSDLSGLITCDFNEKISEIFLNIKADLESVGILKISKSMDIMLQ